MSTTTPTEMTWREAMPIARERGCSIEKVLREERSKQRATRRALSIAEFELQQEQREQYRLELQALVTPEKVKPFASRIRDLFDSDPTAKEQILRIAVEAEAAVFPQVHDLDLETHGLLNREICIAAGLNQQETGLQIFLEDVMQSAVTYSDLHQLRYGTTD